MRNSKNVDGDGKLTSGCLGIVVTTLLLGVYFLVPRTSFHLPVPTSLQNLSPTVGLISILFVAYFFIRMFLSAVQKNNDAFVEDINGYLWLFNLALLISLLAWYSGV